MRRILYALSEIRKGQLKDMAEKHPDSELAAKLDERHAQVHAMFQELDRGLSGISAVSNTEPLEEVMTSADFTYAIQEFVSRLALPGYQRKRFEFEPLVWDDTLPNYLTVSRYQRRAGIEDLEYVGEKGTPRPGSVVDATKRQYRVYRWEKQLDFSHEALVNDDLAYLSDTATQMGEAARRTLEKYVSRFYTNATTIARLVALGALYAQNGRLTSARVSECRMAFNQRTDARAEPINAGLAYIVYHSGLKDTVLQIQNSQLVPELATNAENVVRGTFVGIEDPYIVGTAPNLPWWGFVDHRASGIRPFVLARREGQPGPLILRKRSDIESITSILGPGAPVSPIMGDFLTRNIELAVIDAFGTYVDGTEGNMFDNRGCYYSTGTVP
jgi:hypothetical protein